MSTTVTTTNKSKRVMKPRKPKTVNTTTNINIRIDKEIKQEAESLFDELGLSMSGAINLFFRQAIRERAIPFSIKAKNDDKYNEYFTPEMVKSILVAEEQFKQNNYITFTMDELIEMENGDIPKRAIDFIESNKRKVNAN